MSTDPTNSDATPKAPATPEEREEVYFAGSPALRGSLANMLFSSLIGAALLVGAVLLRAYSPWIPVAGLLLAAALIALPILQVRTIRYRITNYRIDYERGLFSKDIDTLELWHVEDIQYHQSFLDRLLDVARITVLSHDETTPVLILKALPNPRPVFDALKERIIAVKRQRGVVKIDAG